MCIKTLKGGPQDGREIINDELSYPFHVFERDYLTVYMYGSLDYNPDKERYDCRTNAFLYLGVVAKVDIPDEHLDEYLFHDEVDGSPVGY